MLRIVVPYPPGGSNDVFARLVADRLAINLAQPVVVDNRPGAAGVIGTQAVARAPADGYTLLLGSVSLTTSAALKGVSAAELLHEFAPVGTIGAGPHILVVHPDVPARTLTALLAIIRQPNGLAYASSGTGSNVHLATELLLLDTGGRMTHVPYRGNSLAFADLVAGRVQVMLPSLMSVMPQVRAGKLVPIAVSSSARSKFAPDLPTIDEAGVPGYEVQVWWGLLAPAGTPRPIVDRLNQEIGRAIETPALREHLAEEGAEPLALSPEAFGTLLQNEVARWREVVERTHVHIE